MKTLVAAGGSGFLGKSLVPFLSAHGYDVRILSRSAEPSTMAEAKTLRWDGKSLGPWCDALEGATAVVNLVGRSVNCRHTIENRREIVDSRVNSVRALGEAIARCRRPPGVLVQAGSLALYGDRQDHLCTEQTAPGAGFGAEVCMEWEGAVNSLRLPLTRIVLLRIGFALGRGGGALQTLASLTKWFLGGTAGSGTQYVSWIHVDDLNEIIRWSIENSELSGAFNATGPEPVTNREFMHELRKSLGRPWSPPVPAGVIQLGAFLLGTEASLALEGRRCVPNRFLASGFEFKFSQLRVALANLVR